MLHLRFHRRTPSNPTSPVLERASWDTTALQPTHLVPVESVPVPDIRPRSSASVPFAHTHAHVQAQAQAHGQPSSQPPRDQRDQSPPVLPPITRVVSADSVLSLHSQNSEHKPRDDEKFRDDSKPLPRSPYNEQSRFIGGLALENYRREQAALSRPAPQRGTPSAPPIVSSSNLSESSGANAPAPPPPPPVKSRRAASSFVSPTDFQNAPSMGKRPPGAKIASQPSAATNPYVVRDPSKAKKGLPFLKNPMSSLLLRRKTSQSIPDLKLPLQKRSEETVYDPRIRGTRVHDFSAPRQWKPVVQPSNVGNEPTNARDGQVSRSQYNASSIPTRAPPVPPKDDPNTSSRTPSSHSKVHSLDTTLTRRSRDSSLVDFTGAQGENEAIESQDGSTAVPTASMSRKTSAMSVKSSFSAIPKHMKSTSSRFSFDMIGAAEQEKLLEERHRQRQQDKSSSLSNDRRDSRFDEFDEDAFDYDAMDYDDDLEERIPGVNADLDDYEEDFEAANDPDNDQDNFAGFVFQRSDPTSSLPSPHSAGVLPTPRDADGHVIGYAQTGETPGYEQYLEVPRDFPVQPTSGGIHNDDTIAGLGIQGLEPVTESPVSAILRPPELRIEEQPRLSKDDELYFDDGLIHDFDGEGDGSTFDESIFDLNDTDQYGRPIPKMFANALAQRNAALDAKKRESDITSRLSALSVGSPSTAHTSLSADMRSKVVDLLNEAVTSHIVEPQAPQEALSGLKGDGVAEYQAALAAAAHQAAASGKFRRDSSPDPPTDWKITSPTTPGSSHSQPDAINEDPLADYEYDDGFSAGLDDYELDDDAIIAEANASALANDSDGWYGQEFGFYSAPVPQSSHAQSALVEKNIYQYSHGGYFGPSGVDRTASGRIVSREPNLTPITERSEYSNRNSLMSAGWPQGPTNGAIQSPGLAQLAMMAEDRDMSLSTLLKLRSKAWGGSQVSLTSSREGSPYDRNGATSPLNQELVGLSLGTGRKNSTFSIYSQESAGAGSDAGSPTLTMAIPNVSTNSIPSIAMSPNSTKSPAIAPVFSPLGGSTTFPPLSEVEEPSSPEAVDKAAQRPGSSMAPTVSAPSKQRPGHKHKGSADSISYIKEEDSGETRWILERRRTRETGEIEVFDREVVGGGRI
ncbi:hypothetical protein GGS24DRAFT_455446 [Hypoxylon argillaceum]|nr:hypothetical protein GGS24DRAFT_455446 [Hypoxylon argillaceum]KAI1153254.1 hypothetical protein F4825DRAFT_449651 [Nemania diffusa]